MRSKKIYTKVVKVSLNSFGTVSNIIDKYIPVLPDASYSETDDPFTVIVNGKPHHCEKTILRIIQIRNARGELFDCYDFYGELSVGDSVDFSVEKKTGIVTACDSRKDLYVELTSEDKNMRNGVRRRYYAS